jgi:hypothetical protein
MTLLKRYTVLQSGAKHSDVGYGVGAALAFPGAYAESIPYVACCPKAASTDRHVDFSVDACVRVDVDGLVREC